MILNISTRFDISDEYISKLIEKKIMLPESCEYMIERFNGIKVLAIVFGTHNVIIQAYISILN